MSPPDAYSAILHLLDVHGVPYQLLRHAPEGRTEAASAIRGHSLGDAAKCLVVEARGKPGPPRYVLAVIEGNRRVNLKAIKRLYGLDDAILAPRELAEEYGHAAIGAIPPFTLDPRLDVIVDVRLLDHSTIYFNVARLDCSIKMDTSCYLHIVDPCIARIAR